MGLNGFLTRLAGLFGDTGCVLCGAPVKDGKNPSYGFCPGFCPGFCHTCLAILSAEADELCPKCGSPARECACHTGGLSVLPCYLGERTWLSCTWYKGGGADTERLTERMLLACKKHCSRDINGYIAARTGEILSAVLPKDQRKRWILTWAPRSPEGYRQMGFDQCGEIVRCIGRETGIPVRELLTRIGGTEQKSQADQSARQANMTGAFAPRNVPNGCRVLLFDDIITTGATMREASRVLAEAGASAVFPIVFAKTMHQHREQNTRP